MELEQFFDGKVECSFEFRNLMMNKHAYLIIAHNNWNILKLLIKALDREENDFFVHIDAKVKNFDKSQYENLVKHSKIYFIERKSVLWADYSQVEVSLDLLKFSNSKLKYSYYHLLSGVDMPIKSSQYIYDFFEKSKKEYVGIVSKNLYYAVRRVKYYHYLVKFNSFRNHKSLKGMDRLIELVQRVFGVNRLRNNDIVICDGWQWFSITNDFCEFILSKSKYIKNTFDYTIAPDELVFQTLLYNSKFIENVAVYGNLLDGTMRYIDWNRGTPYVWGQDNEDFKTLINSPYLFARKFDENVNMDLVNDIYKYVTMENKYEQ